MAPLIEVLVERDERGQWTPASSELMSDACQTAERLKGTAGGWVLSSGHGPTMDTAPLAACGCRHLHHLISPRFGRWSSEAMAAALADQCPPGVRLIMIPGTARGEEVAGLLAGRMRTTWVTDVLTLAVNRMGALEISAVLPGGKLSRTFRTLGDKPVVITMRPGVAEAKTDKKTTVDYRETTLATDGAPELTAVEGLIAADPKTVDLVQADRIVSAGRGADGPAGVALVAQLADCLGAALGGSRVAVDLGWIEPVRQVGQTGRTVRPELYVACGISGASHHVVGMRASKHIVAINPDAKAPIHELAQLSVRADLHEVIPLIISALQQRPASSRRDDSTT